MSPDCAHLHRRRAIPPHLYIGGALVEYVSSAWQRRDPASPELPVPGEKGIRLGHASDLLEGLTAESFGDLSQGRSLGIGQAESGGQVCSENAILGRQIFVSQQQFLIDKTVPNDIDRAW
jgi:hypothetical protein